MAVTTSSFSPDFPFGAELLGTVLMTDEIFCPFSGIVEDLVRGLYSHGQVNTDQFCYFLCRVFDSFGGQPYLQGSLLKLLRAAQATPLSGELDHCGRCVLKSAALRHAGLHVLKWLQARGLLDVHVIDNREENAIFEVLRRSGHDPEEDRAVLQWVLDQHVPTCQQNALGLQPIHAAALHCKPEAVLQLCRAGADANTATDGDVTPSLQQLVSFHTDDPYIMGVAGSTPLHLALYCRQVIHQPLLAAFIACGADIARLNCRGSTPISVLFDWQSFHHCGGGSPSQSRGSELVWRQVLRAFVGKLGLLTLTLGARQAVSPDRWATVTRMLQEDGVNMDFVPSLQTFCWLRVRATLGGCRFQEKVNSLPVPGKVKHFLSVL
ncbi:uncharacterized protein LOC143281702 [Babylonia areolata]|uniref:uncharacterized protein LOC143281702 n=1 Tax=Babylonia areolata TaxID=304850 RepID=UPI003FD63FD5